MDEMRENENDMNKNEAKAPSIKKTVLCMLLFAVIAVATVWAVVAQNADFSFTEFWGDIKSSDPVYLILAALSMFGYIMFEGIAVILICKAIGYRRGVKRGFIYSASDIYFSAITPSATGGQPASMYFMVKDGIPGTAAVVALVTNLVFYTISILIIGIVTLICTPALFLSFSVTSKVLIVIGYVCLAALAAFFILILFKASIIHAIGSGVIKLLTKMKIVKNPEKQSEKLLGITNQYRECATLILKHKKTMFFAFLFNFLQRAIQITVTAFATLAVGGDAAAATRAWFVQAYTVVGSNCVPIPGAMGVSDYILLDGLGNMMSAEGAVHLELLSRAISFYSMILICGISVLISYIIVVKQGRKNK